MSADASASSLLETHLHREIPLSRQMGVTVRLVSAEKVVLAAPLGPNINHKATAFGGSISTLAILAGWALVHARSVAAGIGCDVIIRNHELAFLAPVTGEFEAEAVFADEAGWEKWRARLQAMRTARVDVIATVLDTGRRCAAMRAEYVAIPDRES